MEKKEENRHCLEADALIQDNLRLVLKIANDFLGRGLPWDDLVSEGNRGLVIAAHRFNPDVGAKFSTYSAWWIKQAIRQAIALILLAGSAFAKNSDRSAMMNKSASSHIHGFFKDCTILIFVPLVIM